MALTITSLDDLTAEQVQQAHAELSQLMQEKYPEIELSRGVVYDILCYFGGVFAARNQVENQRILASQSLLAIEADPALADDDLVDNVLSNYRITRKAGTRASGSITIVVSGDVTTIIPVGAVYTANGLNFVVEAAYTARATNLTPSGATEVALTPQGDGTYAFAIPAACETEGAAGDLRRGTKMDPTSPPGNFVTAYAGSDFTGGAATETNAEILQRMEEGIAAKAWSNAVNITALIKEQAAFQNVLACSVVGYGHPEQMRDQHGILPLSGGGRTDIYVRTAATPAHLAVRKTATLIAITAAGGVWQVNLTQDDAPGFYEVTQVLKPTDDPTDDGFNVTLDLRNYNLTGSGFIPDIQDGLEAAYTRYQTATIQFVDNETPTTDLVVNTSTADYDIVISVMPQIAALQDFCRGWEVRDPGGDCLVKAPIPCFLSINFDIQQATTETAPGLAEIRTALATAVNALGFPGQLHASFVANIVHNYLTSQQAVGQIDLHGRLRRPDGEDVYLRDASILQIPDDPLNLVTGRTTVFILDPNDVGISVLTEGFTTRL